MPHKNICTFEERKVYIGHTHTHTDNEGQFIWLFLDCRRKPEKKHSHIWSTK